MIFFVLSEKMVFLFPGNMILIFRRKMKDLSKKNACKYDIFCICSKDGVFSLQVCYDSSVIKPKMIFFRKNTLKDNISGVIEKDDVHRRKFGISFDRKIKDHKNVYFHKKVLMRSL